MDAATLRADFPEFADVAAYPNATVNFWLALGGKLLDAERWADLLDAGLELFVAHNLVLERQAVASAATGAPPGVSTGMVAAKAVDKVSVNYDTSSAMELDAGHWNLTIYGQRYVRLMRMVGAGPLQF
jgi:hypothetical protein